MDYDKEVINFLSKPENVKLAIEIAEKVEDVKSNIQMKYWITLRKEIEDKITKNNLEFWSVSMSDETNMSPSHSRIKIYQNGENESIHYFLAHENSRLWHGIEWRNEKNGISLDLPDITKLTDELNGDKSINFRKTVTYNKNHIYAWAWIDRWLDHSSTLQSIALDDSIAIETASYLWDFFESRRNLVEKANAAILREFDQL